MISSASDLVSPHFRFAGCRLLKKEERIGWKNPSLLSNLEDYPRSLDLLLSLNGDILCEGHYGIFKGKKEVSKFIRRFMA
jgi:hypothetical protein